MPYNLLNISTNNQRDISDYKSIEQKIFETKSKIVELKQYMQPKAILIT